METTQEKAIGNYFKLKSKYEKQYKQAKKRIIQSDLSLKAKRRRLKKLKPKCIGCKRNVGMSFYIAGKNLIAKCGDEESPCAFNINIERGEYAYTPTLIDSIRIDLENNKTSIIRLKLEILFSLTSEDEIAEKFEELKQQYTEYKNILSMLESVLTDSQLTTIQDMGDEKIIEKKEIITIKKKELEENIAEIRALIKTYMKEDTTSADRQSTLESAIENYINDVLPLLDSIRENMYEISTVLRTGSLFRLVQIKTKLSNQQVVIEKPKIISNVIKGKK